MHIIGFGAVGQAFQRLLARALVVQPKALAGACAPPRRAPPPPPARRRRTSTRSAACPLSPPTHCADITRIHVWAPEIKAAREEGLFSFHPCPPVARETVRDRQFLRALCAFSARAVGGGAGTGFPAAARPLHLAAPCPIHLQLVGVVDGFALKAGDIVVELATRVDTVTMWAEVKSRGAHFLNTGAERGDARGRRRCCRCRRRARHTRLPRAPFLPQALTCGRTWSWT